jgi:glutamine synthetase
MTVLDEIVQAAQVANLSLIRFLYCDTSSIIRGKTSAVEKLKDFAQSGIGLVKGMMFMNMFDQLQSENGLGPVGEVRLVPDLASWTLLPYAPRSAALICDMIELDRRPWSLCPRHLLKRQIEIAEKQGFRFQAAFEPEFTLGAKQDGVFVPIDKSLCFSTAGMNRGQPFINRFVDCLRQQQISVEQYYPELGHGQHELSITHDNALRACDQHLLYRETLRGVAAELDMEAYLSPKPFDSQPGNGCHLHLSAFDMTGNKNLFSASQGLSEFGLHFVAGVLAHLPALVALTCACVNSYRRLKPRSWSSAFVCWGYENREAAIRVPSTYWGREEATANIELKCIDSSCNPYVALAAVIAAGLEGVEKRLVAPPPVVVDPGFLSADEREDLKIKPLPDSLAGALAELRNDKLLMDALGPEFAEAFFRVKQSEVDFLKSEGTGSDCLLHRDKF